MQNSYWNNNSKYQALADALHTKIPGSGSVENPKKNPALEKFRKAVNCYYDLYNNGLCNRAREFAKVFGIASTQYRFRLRNYGTDYSPVMFELLEDKMDEIVLAAAAEQLNK